MGRSPVIPGIAVALMATGAALFLAVLWSDALVGAPRVVGLGGNLGSNPGGTSCSSRVWPYYDAQCLRDLRQPDGRARAVRVVTAGSMSSHIRVMK